MGGWHIGRGWHISGGGGASWGGGMSVGVMHHGSGMSLEGGLTLVLTWLMAGGGVASMAEEGVKQRSRHS